MTDLITSTFIGIGAAMVVFAILQLTARRKARVNYWLGLLFLGFGYVWLYFGLYRATRFAWAPWLLFSDVFVTFLVGPFMYLYTRSLAGDFEMRNPTLRLLSFLPALAVLVYLVLAGPAYAVSALSLSEPDPAYSAVPMVDLLNTIGDAYFFCFVVLSTVVVTRLYRKGNAEFRRFFRGVLVYFVAGLSTFAVYFAGHALREDGILALATLINGVNGTYFFFFSYRYPEYSQKEIRTRARRARTTDSSRSPEVSRIVARLEEIMDSDRGFRDPNLTLQSLSEQLGIQYFRLSEILNTTLHTSFRSYVNTRRLAEAQRLLSERPEMSILEIAFAVGFNSKSAFNSAFSRQTSRSPSDFRKNGK